MTRLPTLPKRQRGTALFVGLIVLLLLSLLAVITANSSIMEGKMASSERSALLAQLAADSALNQAKTVLTKAVAVYGVAEACRHLDCAERGDRQFASPQSFIESDIARRAYTVFQADPTLFPKTEQATRWATDPVYVIEDLGDAMADGMRTRRLFRITARGVGPTAEFVRVAEDTISISY